METIKDPNFELPDPFTDPVIDGKTIKGCGAVTFRKEDKEFRDAYNLELAKVIDSGEHLMILKKYGLTERNVAGEYKSGKFVRLTWQDLCPLSAKEEEAAKKK
jgi:polar amino acid transport system substrate-binding protein